jgi:hypothetical protein
MKDEMRMTQLMNTIEIFNVYYFLYIGFATVLTLLSVLYLDHQSIRFKKRFIVSLIIINFVVHFLKVFIYPYTLVDHVWTKVTFENVSASTVLLFPLLYIIKNQTLKDYMVIIGIYAGLIPFLYPADVISPIFNGTTYIGERPAFLLENIRFYFAHYILFLVSFLMLRYQVHRVSVKRFYKIPFIFIGVLLILFLNELVITFFGGVPVEYLFDPSKRNPSFIFGIKDSFEGLSRFMGILVPRFMEVTHPTYGFTFFIPVVWMILPVLFFGGILVIVFYAVFDKQFLHSIHIKRIERKH